MSGARLWSRAPSVPFAPLLLRQLIGQFEKAQLRPIHRAEVQATRGRRRNVTEWIHQPLLRRLSRARLVVEDAVKQAHPETKLPDGKVEPRIHLRTPQRPATRRRWNAVYDLILPLLRQAKSYLEITDWLGKAHPDLAYSERTLRDIIRWGDAGKP